MTVIEYCREKTEVRELVVIRSGGYERCVAYVDCEDLFRLPPDYTHADVIDFSRDHIKVLDHQGTYLTLPIVETRGFSVLRGLPSGTVTVPSGLTSSPRAFRRL